MLFRALYYLVYIYEKRKENKRERRMDSVSSLEDVKKKKGLSTGTIKIIACISMIIDHFAASVLSQRLLSHGNLSLYKIFPNLNGDVANTIVIILRQIGRPAFLIYAFFITFGFTKTRNKFKYLLRLIILALVSEIPFNMTLSGKVFNSSYQNVFFTLSIGLLTIWLIDICIGKAEKLKADLINAIKDRNTDNLKGVDNAKTKSVNALKVSIFIYVLLALIVFFAGMFLATCLETDYRSMGVTAITAIYLYNRGYKIGSYFVVIMSTWFGYAVYVLRYLLTLLFKLFGPDAQYLPNLKQILKSFGMEFLITCATFTGTALILGIFLAIYYLSRKALKRKLIEKGRPEKNLDFFYSSLLGAMYLFSANYAEFSAFIGSFFIVKFNGEKGWNNKWFFYLFYPVHLALLGLIMVLSR